MKDDVLSLARGVSTLAQNSLREIQGVTRMTKMLAINALVEATHAGEKGRGFAVVAREVESVSEKINTIADKLEGQLNGELDRLAQLSRDEGDGFRGRRSADLALNMIEIIDRNLYERSCDVRWWATDSAVVTCASGPTPHARAYASKRLGVILDAYTVYLDIWIADLAGNVLATGRPHKYPAAGTNVSREPWFRQAAATYSGGEFSVADIAASPTLGRSVAIYGAAIREAGETRGKPLGVLGIFFDWEGQSQTVVDGVRLLDDEKPRTRCLLLDSAHRVIAASDREGLLTERFPLEGAGKAMGHHCDREGRLIGYALTPGYETYKGLGWYGVIVQQPSRRG